MHGYLIIHQTFVERDINTQARKEPKRYTVDGLF
jgi:hypothetical protein